MELNSWSRPDSTSYWNAHEPIGALPVVPSADYMRHSMLDELRGNSELEKVARDSGFLKSDDSMPTVKYLPAPVLSARDAGEEKDQSSAYEVRRVVVALSSLSRRHCRARRIHPADRPCRQASAVASQCVARADAANRCVVMLFCLRARACSSSRGRQGRLSASARGSGDSGANASSTKGLRHFSLAVCNKVREKASPNLHPHSRASPSHNFTAGCDDLQ